MAAAVGTRASRAWLRATAPVEVGGDPSPGQQQTQPRVTGSRHWHVKEEKGRDQDVDDRHHGIAPHPVGAGQIRAPGGAEGKGEHPPHPEKEGKGGGEGGGGAGAGGGGGGGGGRGAAAGVR